MQTHDDWICRVFDDDPDASGMAVCEAASDPRIRYEPNASNLGICENLDRSFSLPPLPGADFLCVLEDDNFYLPANLKCNVATLDLTRRDVLLRNQIIERMRVRDAPGEISENTSFDGQYRDGPLAHDALFATFFYSTGANNSSLFWRAGAGLDFSTVRYLGNPVSQERLRTLCIDRDVVVGMEPLIVWRDNGEESLRPKLENRLRWRWAQVEAAAHERSIYRAVDVYLGGVGARALAFAPPVGGFTADKERIFVRCGIAVPREARHLTLSERFLLHAKRIAAKGFSALASATPLLSIDPHKGRLA